MFCALTYLANNNREKMKNLKSKVLAIVFNVVLFLNTPAISSLPDFTILAEEYSSSVVNVSVVRKQKEKETSNKMRQIPPSSPFDYFNDERLKDFFRNQPQKRAPQKTAGSGFIISNDGYIVTNNHVVEDAATIKITLSNDKVYDAEVVGLDPRMDLALLKIDSKEKFPFITFGNSKESRVGEWVVAIGNPFGLGGTVTAGIISALGRNIGSGPYDKFIQTDAPINKGNSGGPLFNMSGEVIGVNTMIYSQTGGSVGIGFSIPSELVMPVIEQLKDYGETRRGWLGVMIQNVTEESAKDMDLEEARGALIAKVADNGPAEKAGIEENDVIISYNGEDIKDVRDLTTKVANTDIGKNVKIQAIRFGKIIDLKVKIGRLEGNEDTLKSKPSGEIKEILGLGLGDLTDDFRRENQVPGPIKGVAVIEVNEESEAFSKKITKGSVIVSLTHKRVSGNMTLQSTVKAKDSNQVHALLIERKRAGDEKIYIKVWRPELRLVSVVALSFSTED
jgi:serine protease Do